MGHPYGEDGDQLETEVKKVDKMSSQRPRTVIQSTLNACARRRVAQKGGRRVSKRGGPLTDGDLGCLLHFKREG
jgi:hypothetical protein